MNQERLDELAKGLATNSFSRQQVLKGVGAAIAGAALASIPRLAWARTTTCSNDMDCPGVGEICEVPPGASSGNCRKGCRSTMGCSPGSYCSSGRCVNGCQFNESGDDNCPEGEICKAHSGVPSPGALGDCVRGCRDDLGCPEGETCNTIGNCVKGCKISPFDGGDNCPQGEICEVPPGASSGNCVRGCRDDGDCPEICKVLPGAEIGACVKGCHDNTGCPEGQICNVSTETCERGCRENLDCRLGEICEVPPGASSGNCVKKGCRENRDCGVGRACVDGKCKDNPCDPGQSLCDGSCVDPLTEDLYCADPVLEGEGTCGAPCPVGQKCVGGSCTCQQGQIECQNQCVDACTLPKALDPSDCTCKLECPPGSTDCSGVCCSAGQDCCNGRCTTLNTPFLCGTSCSNARTCGSGQACCAGVCTALNTNTDCSDCGDRCDDGKICADGSCECPGRTCQPPRVLNPANCACECEPNQSCVPPRVFNPASCECECQSCPPGQVPDENCRCTCPPIVSVAFDSGLAAPLAAASTSPCNGVCCDVCQECGSTGCVPKCGPCANCNPQTGECEALPETTPCGDTCCGTCQVCEDPTTNTCRNCDSSPPKCEICEGGKCDTMTCAEPKVLNTTNCQCVCPPPPPPPPPPGPGSLCGSQPQNFCGTRLIPNQPIPVNVFCPGDCGFQCCGTSTTAYCCLSHEKCNPNGTCDPC